MAETKTTPIRVTTAQIHQELEDAQIQTLLKYYEVDYSNPFKPRFRPREGVEILVPEGEVLELGPMLDFANAITLSNRRRAYDRLRKLKPYLKPIVSIGDSWFLHPLLRDVINQLIDGHGYAVYSVDAAGAEIQNYAIDERWPRAIRDEGARTVLISGGGNDLMGDHFGSYLNSYTPDDGTGVKRLLNAAFNQALSDVCDEYRTILQKIKDEFPGVKVFTHSYDYVLPRKGSQGKWLGKAMEKVGLNDPTEQKACIRHILDRFTTELKAICQNEFAGIAFYIPRIVSVGQMQWDDEIHPTDDGFAVVAANFRAALTANGVEP